MSTDSPDGHRGRDDGYNGLQAVGLQVRQHLERPIRQFTFWHFLGWLVALGGLSVWIELQRYLFHPSYIEPSADSLILALATVWLAIARFSALYLVFGKDKLMLNVGVLFLVVSTALVLSILNGSPRWRCPNFYPARLRGSADRRAAGTIDTMPENLLSEFEDAVEAYAESDEATRP